ncbi:sensor histidine kinase [Chitinophaga pinensis]|uniref:histidine kinase n=1 Tax=Chitinophaga pinensis (strain ATCC 43595 / DSM 2588 / LMG 13176 / NBRC 15968 / NCIMB 11800 / UQM 2034) TaxID=485918 RepID=A0A979G7U4_CHIPD|nr:HAMP domain-containing sensor histidine kinase [Chitinophaga pinensis]ACU62365.1 histidine kinase [Chitinophaga pinensis DSM 2588]
MKLHNYTLKYLAIALLSIIVLWGVLFYLHIRQQIGESLDRNLSNYKLDFIEAAQKDTSVLTRLSVAGNFFHVQEIGEEDALQVRDRYEDNTIEQDGEKIAARRLGSAFELNGRYYTLEVTTSTLEEDTLVKNILYGIILLYLALLLSVLFINNLLLRKLWRPFYAVIRQIEKFQLGKNTRIATTPTKIAEFASLNETIQSLVARAEDAFSGQRQFVENASHELQTPLAISLNRLELLLENEPLSPEGATAVTQVMKGLERLSRLNKTLLLLTRIENNQYLDTTAVNFNKLIASLIHEFEDLAGHKGVTIRFVENNPSLLLSMNEDLAGILIVNLLKNAIVHNVEQGNVIVATYADRLEISNTGAAEPLDVKRVFDRFYKNSANKQSTGLGLAIVKAIANQYGLHAIYSHRDGLHVITLLFPKKSDR